MFKLLHFLLELIYYYLFDATEKIKTMLSL